MTSKKIWAGNANNISKIDGNRIYKEIPAGIWEPYSSMSGVFLNKVQDTFDFPHKIYGLEIDFIQHVIRTYEHSSKNVGVLMNGIKGAGKTVTAKTLANQSGLPVILVNANNIGLLSYFDDITQPLCFFFDEFEKIINHRDNEKIAPLLSFVDGTSSASKHLMLFTSNENNISTFFIDRPGRIRYIKEYGSLKAEVVKEIIDDMLIHKEFRKDIIDWVIFFKNLTIDMLISIINEVNIHKMSPKQFSMFFNVDNEKPNYTVDVKVINTRTGMERMWDSNGYFSNVSVKDILEEFDDHERTLNIESFKIRYDEEKGGFFTNKTYPESNYLYLDLLEEDHPMYDETKHQFTINGPSFEDRCRATEVYFHAEDKDFTPADVEKGISRNNYKDLVIELEFKARPSYSSHAF